MAKYQLLLPKMGESVAEATIIKWTKKPGDYIEIDDTVMEIATDKVDSEVPSPVAGRLVEQRCKEDEVVQVGAVIAIIETDAPEQQPATETVAPQPAPQPVAAPPPPPVPQVQQQPVEEPIVAPEPVYQAPVAPAPQNIPVIEQLTQRPQASADDTLQPRFYSPLVKHIALQENIGVAELDAIPGSGTDGRLTKDDLLNYIRNKVAGVITPAEVPVEQNAAPAAEKISAPVEEPVAETVAQSNEERTVEHSATPAPEEAPVEEPAPAEATTEPAKPQTPPAESPKPAKSMAGQDEIIEMDRMRRLIAEHMVMSKHTSPHVTSFVEADVTSLVLWREKIKNSFEKREGEKITFTPIFIEAIVKAIKDYPMVNVSVSGTQITKKANINISMATALPNGNLIVPVIKLAHELNLLGLTKAVNSLAAKARTGKLQPDDVKDGTFTITNVGSFGNVMGTPIINQPQAAILAVGAIKKKPAVIETPEGDAIAIRHMMFLSLSYDHRVIDGALGGTFLSRIAYYLENWDADRWV